MSKLQIEKDLKELTPGGNYKAKIKEYYKAKKKEMMLLLIMALVLIGISFFLELQSIKPEENKLNRNQYGEGRKEVSLELKINEEKWIPFSVILEEKEYTEEELKELYIKIAEELPNIIKKENSTLEIEY